MGSGSECAKRYPERVQLAQNGRIVHSSFSKYHGMCLDSFGSVYSWGIQSNQKGRLGYAEPSVVLYPKEIKFPDSIKIAFISTSDNHSVLISTTGRTYVIGSNQFGQIGLGTEVRQSYKAMAHTIFSKFLVNL